MKTLDTKQSKALIASLQLRFEKNSNRHPKLTWGKVLKKLEDNPHKLFSLHQMELSGGEPDVVGVEDSKGLITFMDCSPESPTGRRSLCFDQEALDARKENKPAGSAMGMAAKMGIEILTEEQYRYLQSFGTFDAKTSSWIQTPTAIRKLGGALFADYRYDHTFVYHNGAQSYYAARGFRGVLTI